MSEYDEYKLDVNDNPLQIGDKVVYAISLKTELYIGTIVRFTNKLVYLSSEDGYTAQRLPHKLCKIR